MKYKIMYINPKTGFVEYTNFEGNWYELQEFIHEEINKDEMIYPVVFDESGEIADYVSERNFRYEY